MSDLLQIICGDALTELRKLPSESVHCTVTSPPFWGLRDYQTGRWEGGDEACDHAAPVESGNSGNKSNSQTHPGRFVDCKCGAKRIDSQLGLEKTPELFVQKMVAVFREVKRVLRKDGTLWLNLGDSYAHNGPCGGSSPDGDREYRATDKAKQEQMGYRVPPGLKPKDLCGIPWRVAMALQADGWWLRSDIIWAKPNPMPESCTDRPTKAHEYLFLLTKSASYFYDAEAIKEQVAYPETTYQSQRLTDAQESAYFGNAPSNLGRCGTNPAGRNKRSVWTVATAPYPEAHFATYPPDLIKPCIMAGTSAKGCCAKCGAPWERVTTTEGGNWQDRKAAGAPMRDGLISSKGTPFNRKGESITQTTGWIPTCSCIPKLENGSRAVPCTVLDPFAGSGTTGAVVLELGRKAVLIELNPTYVKLIKERCSLTPGLALA